MGSEMCIRDRPISLYCPTVIALTETWLESSIPSSFFCPANNYVPYRRDRSCKRGGGSVILVKDTLISKPLEIYSTGAERESSIDAVAVGLLLDDGRGLGILCIYRPPSSSLDDYFSMIGIIKKFFSFNLHYNIILGDFNFADICWPTSASSSQSKLFLTFCQESFLTQHIVAPTRMVSGSILDLVLSTQGTEITNIIINEEFGSSDHSIIQLSLVTRASFFSKSISKRSFKNADWDLFRRLLLPSPDWRDALSTEDVDITWAYFLSSLNAALDHVAPYSHVTVRNSVSTSKTRTALRYKRRCYHELFQKPSLETLISYKRSKLIAHRVLEEYTAHREERIIRSKNTKLFWSYVNRRLGSDSRIKSIDCDGQTIHNSQVIADRFNDYFVSNFSNLTSSCSPVSPTEDNEPSWHPFLSSVDLSLEDVSAILRKLPPKTSVDSDNISYMILKNGGSSIALRLFQLFSLSLRVSRIPFSWKAAIVSPIFKKGSKSDIRNYRPISVTSCCSRILERIISRKITNFLSSNNLMNTAQHGFTHKKSTNTLLISFYD